MARKGYCDVASPLIYVAGCLCLLINQLIDTGQEIDVSNFTQ